MTTTRIPGAGGAATSPAEHAATATTADAASATPLSDEAAAFERAARYLKHAFGGVRRGYGGRALTWLDARLALEDRAQALRDLAAKAHPCLAGEPDRSVA